jgi:phosphoribosylformylglycinamidine synthase
MERRPHAVLLKFPGTNCDGETARALRAVGFHADIVPFAAASPETVLRPDLVVLPGGFSYGDDIAAGRILGNQIQHHLADALESFRESGKLILGICNGFQALLKTNLLADTDERGPTATLTLNDSGRFEARWVRLGVEPGNCVFLQGIREMELPVAHAEGKFVVRDEEVFRRMVASGQLVLRYCAIADCGTQRVPGIADSPEQSEIRNPKSEIEPNVPYPDNPNGAMGDVAGICDATGRVLGLMPHPERFVDPTQHPRWTREPKREAGDGLRVFQNAVRFFM